MTVDYEDLTKRSDDELAVRLAQTIAAAKAASGADERDDERIGRLCEYQDAVAAEIHRRKANDPAPEGWQGITDDPLAAWAMDKLAEAHAERDRLRRNAQAYIDQIQADALRDESPLTDRIAWFEGELRAYFEGLPGDPSTYKLPNGQIQRRKGRTSTKVVDADEFLAWAAEHLPDAVKRTPLVSALKGATRTDDGTVVTDGGEIVPGVEIVTAEPTVTIKPAGRPS